MLAERGVGAGAAVANTKERALWCMASMFAVDSIQPPNLARSQ